MLHLDEFEIILTMSIKFDYYFVETAKDKNLISSNRSISYYQGKLNRILKI